MSDRVTCPICEGQPAHCGLRDCEDYRWCDCDLPPCPECDDLGWVPDPNEEPLVAHRLLSDFWQVEPRADVTVSVVTGGIAVTVRQGPYGVNVVVQGNGGELMDDSLFMDPPKGGEPIIIYGVKPRLLTP